MIKLDLKSSSGRYFCKRRRPEAIELKKKNHISHKELLLQIHKEHLKHYNENNIKRKYAKKYEYIFKSR